MPFDLPDNGQAMNQMSVFFNGNRTGFDNLPNGRIHRLVFFLCGHLSVRQILVPTKYRLKCALLILFFHKSTSVFHDLVCTAEAAIMKYKILYHKGLKMAIFVSVL